MQPEPIVVPFDLSLRVLVLGVLQLGLAPRRVRSAEIDAQGRHGNEPVVDLGAIDRVLAKGQTRVALVGALIVVGLAEVGAPGPLERRDLVLPGIGKDADGIVGGGWPGTGEAQEREGSCECRFHGWLDGRMACFCDSYASILCAGRVFRDRAIMRAVLVSVFILTRGRGYTVKEFHHRIPYCRVLQIAPRQMCIFPDRFPLRLEYMRCGT